jgi:hypothetical protein
VSFRSDDHQEVSMRRQLSLSFLVLVTAALGTLPASADVTLSAHGTVTFTIKTPGIPVRTCSAVSAVQFTNSGSTFLLVESTPAGQASGTPPVCTPLAVGPYFTSTTTRLCTPSNGGVIIPGSALTVSGNTYTVRSPYTSCTGKNATDTIVLTVSGTSVAYRHDLNDGDGTEIHVLGTLTRDV